MRQWWRVRRRVRRNLRQVPEWSENPLDRLALRHLFSALAGMEQIAVLAAERGDGVQDQLVDELSHRDTFRRVAESLGGLAPIPDAILDLITYLESLEGDASNVALNVIAESWLNTVFAQLRASSVAPDLFAVIGAEESRHVQEAMEVLIPWPDDCADVVRDLEEHLVAVSASPGWLLPLVRLIGVKATAQIGLEGVRGHRAACVHLLLLPGSTMRDLEATCRAAISAPSAPREIEPSSWEISKIDALWPGGPAPMMAWEPDCWIPDLWDFAAIEAAVVRACARAIARYPRLNRTCRNGLLYQPQHIAIGVRRLHNAAGDLVMPVAIRDPQGWTLAQVMHAIEHRVERGRSRPYRAAPALGELDVLVPPASVAIAVSFVPSVPTGTGPLADLEGCGISLIIGGPRLRPRWDDAWQTYRPHRAVSIGVQYDHRIGDGTEIGALVSTVQEELGRSARLEVSTRPHTAPGSSGIADQDSACVRAGPSLEESA